MPRGRAEAILPGFIGNIALVARRASALRTIRRENSIDSGGGFDRKHRIAATQVRIIACGRPSE